ncbi:zinc finger protein 316-like [Alosa sapidissima]|uniref:zinc finger protein 316-like n=1 Tax=Alosa sapidissima TaxID=34773 RepID=UPI001C09E164|nr:zinc finger protein 316-like [Alosa sapidissima]
MYAVILPKYRLSVPSMPPPLPSSINMEDGNQQQYVEMTYKQVCIDLERATQCITQILQSEVESNKQLKLKIDQLQNGLEEKDKLLTQANQTVTYLRNELMNLHQRLQSTNSASKEVKGGYDGELKTEVKEEADNDGYGDSSGAELIQTVLVLSDGQRLLLPPISGDGDDMYSQSGKGSSSQSPGPPSSRRKFPCPVCGKGFRFRYDLNMHHKRLHTCHKQPCASSSPAVHTASSIPERLYACAYCPKRYVSPGNLRSHERSHVRSKSHACPKCRRTFLYKKQLVAHLHTHVHDSDPVRPRPRHARPPSAYFASRRAAEALTRRFQCFMCPRAFTDRLQLDTHRRQRHNSTMIAPVKAKRTSAYACGLCQERFTSSCRRAEHERTAHAKEESEFVCPLTSCGRRFRMEEALITHEWHAHKRKPQKRKLSACTLCGHKYTGLFDLLKHTRRHTAESGGSVHTGPGGESVHAGQGGGSVHTGQGGESRGSVHTGQGGGSVHTGHGGGSVHTGQGGGSVHAGQGGESRGSVHAGQGGGSVHAGQGGESRGSVHTGQGGGSVHTGQGGGSVHTGQGGGSVHTGQGGESRGSVHTGQGGGSVHTGQGGESRGSVHTGQGGGSVHTGQGGGSVHTGQGGESRGSVHTGQGGESVHTGQGGGSVHT